MAVCKGQCDRFWISGSSNRWRKRAYNKFLRRQAKRNPQEAWRKHYFWGYA